MKYHINNKGEVRPCRAKIKCRFESASNNNPGIGDNGENLLSNDEVRQNLLNKNRDIIETNVARVAKLGEWPDHVPSESLLSRISKSLNKTAPGGFDAGVACAMDLIPREKQRLAASFHAAYTPERIEQARNEIADGLDADSETTWWLSACAVCEEGNVTGEFFLDQLKEFHTIKNDPAFRQAVARKEVEIMKSSYSTDEGFVNSSGKSIPFVTRDGGSQGAYLDGYNMAVQYAESYDLYFVGTYHKTLGLPNDFEWASENSGGVHGSVQFVKCSDREEVNRVLKNSNPHD